MWWNPALEDQAFDRTHRLRQTRDVNIYKLTIENAAYSRTPGKQARSRHCSARWRQVQEPQAWLGRSHGPVQARQEGR